MGLSDEARDEFARTVTANCGPTKISTRGHETEEVVVQRMRSTLETTAKAGRVASKTSCVTRMSSIQSQARQAIIDSIKRQADARVELRMGLESRLQSFGMRTKEMEGDGNCQFRSFAFNLFGEQRYHSLTRKAAVAHMSKHKEFFGMFFESAGEFKTYLRDMSKNRTWGDELTLRAVVEAYMCEAHVVTSESQNWYLVYQPESKDSRDLSIAVCPKGVDLPKIGKQVFLSYVSPIHYNSIIAMKQTE